MASPAPVLPLVGSTIVPPGLAGPLGPLHHGQPDPVLDRAAGFRYSTLASRVGASPRPSRDSRTSGVPPTTSRIESYTSMPEA